MFSIISLRRPPTLAEYDAILNRRATNFSTERCSSFFQAPLKPPARIFQAPQFKLSASEVEKLLTGTDAMKNISPNRRLAQVAILVVIAAALVISLSAFKRTYGSDSGGAAWAGGSSLVARVEGRDISARVYEMYLKNGIQSLGLSDGNAEGRRRLARLKEGIVAELIDRALIEAEVERRGLAIAADTLDSRYRRRVEEMGGDAAYRAYMNETNITDGDFRQIVRSELCGEMLQQELSRDLMVEASEAQAFYDKEKSNPKYAALFAVPESVRASHILINARRLQIRNELQARGTRDQAQLDRMVADELNKRRAHAADILNQLKRGADFAALARRYSDDASTRERGGDLGLFTRDTHTPRFDEAAFALGPGQLSQVVETDYGFHVIKVTEHHPERARRFDEVRGQIEQQLLARKRAEQLTAWLKERRRSASISINPTYRTDQSWTDAK
jgi:parvulin-like peptidyl-prolyl isomerase